MNRDSPLAWSELLRRRLQSLRDTAAVAAYGPYSRSNWCDDCTGDQLVALADAHSGQPERLPHWLAHALHITLADIRVELLWTTLAQPLGQGDVGDAIVGIGELDPDDWTPLQQQADQILADHHAIVALWLQTELRAFAPWAARILRTGSRLPLGLRISSRYLERCVLADPDAAWITIMQPRSLLREPVGGTPGSTSGEATGLPEALDANGSLPTDALADALPDWLSSAERREVIRLMEADLAHRSEQHRRTLERAARRLPDPDERRAELFIADAECEQADWERREELLHRLHEHRADLALILASIAHDAHCAE